jgi:peptidoglycan/xylan/chitin deacetylase (PgdA/CDA1 family)
VTGVRTSLPVLTFHSLDDLGSVISFSPALFRRGLSTLREHGYHTIDLMEAVDILRRGGALTAPDRCLVLTFDDGFGNNYREAFPALGQSGMSATIFLTVGRGSTAGAARLSSLNGRDMLSWSEIREMHDSGVVRFGAHTMTHPDLTRLTTDRIDAELRESKAIIEVQLGAEVTCFAYPYGRYDVQSRDAARRYFECACSDRLGLITRTSDVFALERVDAYYLRTDRLFNLLLSDSFPWYIRARSVPRRIRRAVTRARVNELERSQSPRSKSLVQRLLRR